MKAQSFLHKVEDGKDPRKARPTPQRPTTVGAVYTHVNKSRPGRKSEKLWENDPIIEDWMVGNDT